MTATLPNPFTARERAIMRPRRPLRPSEWAERNVIVGRDSPAPGRFSRLTMPVLTSPMDSILDPRYQEICAVAATQSGKSQAMNQILLGYWLEHCRCHTAFGVPNRKIASRVYKTKLQPMFDAVPSLSGLLPKGGAGSRGGFPTEQILQNGALWLFLGAGSAADMSQATVERLVVDETDKADDEAASGKEANPLEQMIRRTDAHHLTRRIVYTCTPTSKDGHIWRKYLSGTEGKPWFRCALCGEWIWWEWSWENQRVAWDDDTSEVSAMDSGYYPCPKCNGKLREDERLSMLRHPLWVHAGEDIRACSADEAAARGPFDEAVVMPDGSAYRVAGDRKATRTISFWWNRLCSPFTTLGHLAASIYKAKKDPEVCHSITIYDMALPWEEKDLMDLRSWDSAFIRTHSTPYYPRTLPQDCQAVKITMGADVHAAAVYYVFRAWAADATSWLLEAGVISVHHMPGSDDAARVLAVDNALDRLWAVFCEGFDVGTEDAPRRIGCDRGYVDEGWETAIVRHACARQDRRGLWVPGKGFAGLNRPLREAQKDSPCSHALAVDRLKHILARLMQKRRWVEDGQEKHEPGYWHIHGQPHHDYVHHLCAEEWRPKKSKLGTNPEEWEWATRSANNHWWDAEVYALAAAMAVGVPAHKVGSGQVVGGVAPPPRQAMGEPRKATAGDYRSAADRGEIRTDSRRDTGSRPGGQRRKGGWSIGR